jgi:hypothetical protein
VGPVIRRWEGSRVLDVRARVWDGGDEGEGEAEEGCAGGREKEGVETAIWESGRRRRKQRSNAKEITVGINDQGFTKINN